MTIDKLKSTNDITSLHLGGYSLTRGQQGCAAAWDRIFTTGVTIRVAYNTKALPQPSLRYREASAEERDTQVIALSRFSYTKTFCCPLLLSSHNQVFAGKRADKHLSSLLVYLILNI